MPFVNRIFWLSSVKEALGHIPDNFNLSHEEILGLVWLSSEQSKKVGYESWKMHQESNRSRASAASMRAR